MTDFLETMSALLSGQPAPQSPPPQIQGGSASGTAPSPATSASPGAQLLARIPTSGPPGQGGTPGSSSNPLGLNPIPGGNDLGVAMSGLASVKPGAGRFSAFAQGLAGSLSARSNADAENRKLGIQQTAAGWEALKNAMALQTMQNQQDAISKAGTIGTGGGGGYPAFYNGPGGLDATARQGGQPVAAPPMQLQPPSGDAVGGTAPSPALPAVAVGMPPPGTARSTPSGQGDAAPAGEAPPITVSPAVANTGNFWQRVDPESNPYFLRQRAAIMDQKAAVPGLPAEYASNFGRQAQQDRASAEAITNSNTVMLRDGRKVLIPGSIDAETTMAAAKAGAEKHAQELEAFRAAPGVTPSGTKYTPDPNAPAPLSASPPPSAPSTAPAAGPAVPQRPQSASIDPETATVATAIPRAPAGGGYPVPADLPPGAKMTDLSPAGKAVQESDKEFYGAMGNAPALDQTIEKYQSLAQAFKLFESGPRADHLQGAAMIAYGYGQPEIAQKILGGDPNALQWVEKEGAPLTLNALKSATTRFSQQEFKAYNTTAVPNYGKLPQANHQMIAKGLAAAQQQKQYNLDWEAAKQQGWTSPSAFYQQWSKANPPNSFVQAAQRQIGNFQGMATPSPDQWAQGVSYVYNPKGMTPQQQAIFQQEGVKPGGLFRFNGRSSDHAISPIDTSGGRGFSSYLQ